jgi:hypothetical protein
VRDVLATVTGMVAAFRDEEGCRRPLEAMIWPRGRICPVCGCRDSTALAGRDVGRRARPGLDQCSNRECRFQFTVTTRTPLHSTKLPLRVWLTGLWLILQSDRGSPRCAWRKPLGSASRPPGAWAMRLLVTGEHQLNGTVEIDEFYIGGSPRKGSRPAASWARAERSAPHDENAGSRGRSKAAT